MLNAFQKKTLEDVIEPLLEQITQLRDPFVALKGLQATLQAESSNHDISTFVGDQIWEAVKTIREIMLHRAPQNRRQSGFVCPAGMVGFIIHEDRFNSIINVRESSKERVVFHNGLVYEGDTLFSYSVENQLFEGLEVAGLLALSELNHSQANGTNLSPVTRDDVVNHIASEVQKRSNALVQSLHLPLEQLVLLPSEALYLHCRSFAEIAPSEPMVALMFTTLGPKLDDYYQALLLTNNKRLAYSLSKFAGLGPVAKHMLHSQLTEESGLDQQYLFRQNEHIISHLESIFKKDIEEGINELLKDNLIQTLDDRLLALLIKDDKDMTKALFEHDAIRPYLGPHSLLEIMLANCKIDHAFSIDFLSTDEGLCWQRLGGAFQRYLLPRATAITKILYPRHVKNMEPATLIDLVKLQAVHEPDFCADLLSDASLAAKLASCKVTILGNYPAVASGVAMRERRILTLAELRHLPPSDLALYCHHNKNLSICLPIMLDHALRNTLPLAWQKKLLDIPELPEALHARGISVLIQLHPHILSLLCERTARTTPSVALSIINSGLRNRLEVNCLLMIIATYPAIVSGIFELGPSLWQKLDFHLLNELCEVTALQRPEITCALLRDRATFAILDLCGMVASYLIRFSELRDRLAVNPPPHLAGHFPAPEEPAATSLSKRPRL